MAPSSCSISPGSSASQRGGGVLLSVDELRGFERAGVSLAGVIRSVQAVVDARASPSWQGYERSVVACDGVRSPTSDLCGEARVRGAQSVGLCEPLGTVVSQSFEREFSDCIAPSVVLRSGGAPSLDGSTVRRGGYPSKTRRSRRGGEKKEAARRACAGEADGDVGVVARVLGAVLSDVSDHSANVALLEPELAGVTGYGYMRVLRPSECPRAVVRLGSRPSLRRLLAMGPKAFRPLRELAGVPAYSVGGGSMLLSRRGESAGEMARRASFLSLVQAVPPSELSRSWQMELRKARLSSLGPWLSNWYWVA